MTRPTPAPDTLAHLPVPDALLHVPVPDAEDHVPVSVPVSVPDVEVIVPTVGRPSLHALLFALLDTPQSTADDIAATAVRVTVVDDRRLPEPPLSLPARVRVLRSGGRGPAAARNTGWRATSSTWVAFLDDDVLPPTGWYEALLRDLAAADATVGGVQGRIRVPLPRHRRATDWERGTAGLQDTVWATADLAYRRAALTRVGGFDERFPRAFREDADLGLRVIDAGWRITLGSRHIQHPVRPAPWHASLSAQRGNRDDVLMLALHGRRWRSRAHVPAGRRRWHLATTAAAITATFGPRRSRPPALLLWAALTADFAVRRIAPGPRTPSELGAMLTTSALIPPAATWHWLRGWLALPRLLSEQGPRPADAVVSRAAVGPTPAAAE